MLLRTCIFDLSATVKMRSEEEQLLRGANCHAIVTGDQLIAGSNLGINIHPKLLRKVKGPYDQTQRPLDSALNPKRPPPFLLQFVDLV